MRFRYNNFFTNTTDETKWLDNFAKKGLHLVKRAPFTYYFEYVDEPDTIYNYKVIYMHDAVENGASDEEIKIIPDDGSVLTCGYKNKAYFKKAGDIPHKDFDDSHARLKHFVNIWIFYAFLFVASLAVFTYHLNFAIKMMLENKPIPSVSVLAATIIALVFSAFLFAFYADKTMFWRKKLKEATLKKLLNDQI